MRSVGLCRSGERPTDPDVITHCASSQPTCHSVTIPCCLEIRLCWWQVTVHMPRLTFDVNMFFSEGMIWRPKPQGAIDLSLQTVWLQSPVSNLNLLCHLKSPWTNLTLACNNGLEECLSVLCARPQPYLLWSWSWEIMTHSLMLAHVHARTWWSSKTLEINQNFM